MTDSGALWIGGSGKHDRHFPHPFWPWEASWASGPGPPLSKAPSTHVGPRGMGGGKKRRGGQERALQDWRIEGEHI